jgi:hypothetical protein
MLKYHIVGADGKVYGPVGVDEIRMWLHEGRANGQTLVQGEGGTEWVALGAVPELAALMAKIAAAPAAFSPTPFSEPKNNRMAVAGFTCSILGTMCCMVTLFSVLGLIFSVIGLRQISKDPSQKGHSLAVAGIAISIIGLILAAISWVYFFGVTLQEMRGG